MTDRERDQRRQELITALGRVAIMQITARHLTEGGLREVFDTPPNEFDAQYTVELTIGPYFANTLKEAVSDALDAIRGD